MNRMTDRFGRRHSYLRISLTDRCNLRCTYCMPEQTGFAPRGDLLTTAETLRLAALFVRLGVDKIRLTGGEPTLQRDLLRIVAELSALDGLEVLAMTTNAVKLPALAADLRRAGLTTLTISLDSLKRDRFAAITRRDRLPDVLAGIDAALDAGFAPLKLNIVVMANVNDDELLDFVAWGKDKPVELRFIEYMPFPDTRWSQAGLLPYAVMRDRIAERYALTKLADGFGAVGKGYALDGYMATVSFVSSMTDSFCSTCNRLRLTADGNIKACLFDPAEKSLRDVMRSGGDDDALAEIIAAALDAKPAAHPPMDDLLKLGNRTMVAIGG